MRSTFSSKGLVWPNGTPPTTIAITQGQEQQHEKINATIQRDSNDDNKNNYAKQQYKQQYNMSHIFRLLISMMLLLLLLLIATCVHLNSGPHSSYQEGGGGGGGGGGCYQTTSPPLAITNSSLVFGLLAAKKNHCVDWSTIRRVVEDWRQKKPNNRVWVEKRHSPIAHRGVRRRRLLEQRLRQRLRQSAYHHHHRLHDFLVDSMEFMLDFACDTACGDLPVCPTIDVRRRYSRLRCCCRQGQKSILGSTCLVLVNKGIV